MKLEDAVYECIHRSPSLFYFKDHPTMSDFEISRMAVLEHLFLTNGNGYAWADGYLVDCEYAKEADFVWPTGWIAKGPKYGKLKHQDRTWPPERSKEFPMFAWEYLDKWDSYEFVKNTKRSRKWPFSIYPISSDGFALPAFVRPDWLQGAREVCEFALQYFGDPHSLDGSNKVIDLETRHRSILILEGEQGEIDRRISDTER